MRKCRMIWFSLLLLMLVSLSACGNKQESVDNTQKIRTFSDWTKQAEFQEVPAMDFEGTKVNTVEDYGAKTYIVSVSGTTTEQYQDYLKLMEKAGFKKYADNGEQGLNQNVYAATFTKDGLTVNVTQTVKTETTYIAACATEILSEHLIYKDEYVADNVADTKTKLHMLEMCKFGNSIIIQMKNGNFILNDGGNPEDTERLLDYLQSLTAEGKKPVVEAWFVSHAHGDHTGPFEGLVKNPSLFEKIHVEGVYYCEPSSTVVSKFDNMATAQIQYLKMAVASMKTSNNEKTPLYRIHTGQKLYFSDIVIDVALTQEQMLYEQHYRDFNDTSTWLMYHIDDTKYLLSGDADYGAMQTVMDMYDSNYFELDIYTVFHHGINVWDKFNEWIQFNTALYPNYRVGSLWPDNSAYSYDEENARLQEMATECYAYGRGTVVLTFPYKVGTAEILPGIDWSKYVAEREFEQELMENFSVKK